MTDSSTWADTSHDDVCTVCGYLHYGHSSPACRLYDPLPVVSLDEMGERLRDAMAGEGDAA